MTYYDFRIFLCVDCGSCTYHGEYYMVKDNIWGKSGAGDKMLCIKDLEKRLGRKLRSTDFSDCPLNSDNRSGANKVSSLLASRLKNK